MKTEDCSKLENKNCQPERDEKLMGRREVLNKAGWYALSAATMMVLMKSQPAMASSDTFSSPAMPSKPSGVNNWQRTTRS